MLARVLCLKWGGGLRHGARIAVFQQHVRLPDGREVADFLRVDTQPFACILARTADGKVICERQYKHGAGRVILSTFDREEAWAEASEFPEIWQEEDES